MISKLTEVESDVKEFMTVAGQTMHGINDVPDLRTLSLRHILVDEEVNDEFAEALQKMMLGDNSPEVQAELLDAIVDSVYVLVGTAIALGLPFTEAWNEVQRANMAKFAGGVKKTAAGKVLKPEGWQPPDILSIIRRARG